MEIKKIVTLKFEGMNVSLSVDSDVDGEPSIALQVKLPELFSEVVALISNKPAAPAV
jgi:hypothetical protein